MLSPKLRSTITLGWLILIGGLSVLGQFARLETPLGRLSGHEIVMVVFIAWIGLDSLFNQLSHRKFPRPGLSWLLSPWLWGFLWLIWTMVTTMGNAWWWHSSLLLTQGLSYLGRTLLYVIFARSLYGAVQFRLVSRQHLTWGISIWLILQTLFGLGQYLFLPDTRLFKLLGWDDHFNRAFGTLFDPGFYGLILGMSVIWWLEQLLSKKIPSWLSQIMIVLSLIMVVLTYSRASYVALGLGLLVWIVSRRQVRGLLLIVALMLGVLLAPKDGGGEGQKLLRTNSVAAREEVIVHHTRSITWPEILVGRGWYYEGARQLQVQGISQDAGQTVVDQSVGRNNAQSVDNLYLHVFLSTGTVGTLLFTISLGLWLKQLWPDILLRTTMMIILCHSLFSTSLLYPWVLLLIAFFLSEQPSAHQKENHA
jgi:hypothetical protein